MWGRADQVDGPTPTTCDCPCHQQNSLGGKETEPLTRMARPVPIVPMCNLYSITTNQAAIIALFRVINRYVGNLPPTVGFASHPAVRNEPIVLLRRFRVRRVAVITPWGTQSCFRGRLLE